MRHLFSIMLLWVLGFSSIVMADEISDLTARAEAGEAKAQFSLALLYDKGEGVLQDFRQAVVWYTKAAEQDNEAAQFFLGEKYFMGEGIPPRLRTSLGLVSEVRCIHVFELCALFRSDVCRGEGLSLKMLYKLINGGI